MSSENVCLVSINGKVAVSRIGRPSAERWVASQIIKTYGLDQGVDLWWDTKELEGGKIHVATYKGVTYTVKEML